MYATMYTTTYNFQLSRLIFQMHLRPRRQCMLSLFHQQHQHCQQNTEEQYGFKSANDIHPPQLVLSFSVTQTCQIIEIYYPPRRSCS